jgi:hypothetical protein
MTSPCNELVKAETFTVIRGWSQYWVWNIQNSPAPKCSVCSPHTFKLCNRIMASRFDFKPGFWTSHTSHQWSHPIPSYQNQLKGRGTQLGRNKVPITPHNAPTDYPSSTSSHIFNLVVVTVNRSHTSPPNAWNVPTSCFGYIQCFCWWFIHTYCWSIILHT